MEEVFISERNIFCPSQPLFTLFVIILRWVIYVWNPIQAWHDKLLNVLVYKSNILPFQKKNPYLTLILSSPSLLVDDKE